MPGFSDLSLPLRKAIITHLRAAVGVSALVGARIYETVPPDDTAIRPYIRYGVPIIGTFDGTDGNETEITLHVFADGPGTDSAYAVMAAIVASLDNASVSAVGARIDVVSWIGSALLPDEDAQALTHGVVRFKINIVGA